MGVRVLEVGDERLRISAPLEPNINHRSTAFGGSLAALAILVGWAWVHTRLDRSGIAARTVIQRTEVDYTAPIDGGFEAVCELSDSETWGRFVRTLARRGRARIQVTARVESAGREAATFVGAYVAFAHPAG